MATSGSRIAKNTLALYFRMLLTTGVSLYTSRIVLDALGTSDFGLFAVVGGVVTLMGFLNAATISSTQRFLNFEKGARDTDRQRRVFGTSLLIHILLAGVILLVSETVGMWFLTNKLNVTPGREEAAVWVFQCALLGFLVNTIFSPYNAAIISNERMTAFAYTSLLDAVLRLGVAFALLSYGADKLKLYAVLMLSVSAVLALVYFIYARRNFPECRTKPLKDVAVFREMLSFSSWSVLSNLSVVLRIQGVAILINLFFGVVVNAALGIATQVNTALQSFSAGFTQALNPQIVTNYAAGDIRAMHTLIFNGCRLSFFLVLLFSLPAILETEAILNLWLKDVPQYTTTFVRLMLLQSLIDSFASVLATSQGATGRIKHYHITLSAIGLLNLPISYMLLKMGAMPYMVLMVSTGFAVVIGVLRLVFLRKSIKLPLRLFSRQVVLPCGLATALALVGPLLMKSSMPSSLLISLLVMAASGLSVIVAVALVGVTSAERRRIKDMVVSRLGRRSDMQDGVNR
jgi:O-antigen/teichoic acid export membrane protein